MSCATYGQAALAICLSMVTAHTVSAVPVAPFDFDANGRVDSVDAQWFVACGSGAGVPAGGGGCPPQIAYAADRDGDLDVDPDDFGAFQRCYAGASPAHFDCVPPIPPLPLLQHVLGDEDTPFVVTLTAFDPHSQPVAVSFTVIALPAKGRLSQADGTLIVTVPAAVTDPGGKLQYLAEPDQSGAGYATFAYTATSLATGLTSSSRLVAIDVAPVNDLPVLDVTPIEMMEDTPAIFQLKASDPDEGDTSSFQVVEAPVSGTLYQVDESGVPLLSQPLTPGMFVSNSHALVHHVPRPNFYGTDSVRLRVFDHIGPAPFTSILPIHIAPVNDPPVAMSLAFDWPNDFGPLIRNVNLVVTDADPLTTIQVCITTLPETGILSTFPDNVPISHVPFCTTGRNFVYLYPIAEELGKGCITPPPDLPTHFPLHAASFTYEAFDGQAHSAPAQVNLQFVYQNTAPYVTSTLQYTTDEDVPVTFTLSGADLDGELVAFVVDPAVHGVMLVNGHEIHTQSIFFNNTVFTFVPAADFNSAGGETASIPFVIVDQNRARDCQYAVTFNINPVNDAPVLSGPDFADTDEISYVQFAWLSFIHDDAFADTLLKVDVVGTGVASVNMPIPQGLTSLEQLSPTHIRMTGTLSALNNTFNVGVFVVAASGNPPVKKVDITVDDQGNSGSGTPHSTSVSIPVQLGAP